MLEISHLSCGYPGHPVLNDISFSVQPGELVVVLGPNGSGKTTLLRALTNRLDHREGSLSVQDTDIRTLSPGRLARLIAVVPQSPRIPPDIRVRDLVLLGRFARLSPLGFYTATDIRAAEASLARTGAAQHADRLFHELSGGEAQRVLLAMALAQETPVLLLDELSAHIDPAGSLLLFQLLEQLAAQKRCILAISHDPLLAQAFATRVIGLRNGVILFDCPPQEACSSQHLSSLYDMELKSVHIKDTLELAYPAFLERRL